jgi:signal peptidase I
MFAKFRGIPSKAWYLFLVVTVFSIASAVIRGAGLISSQQYLYVVQPIFAVIVLVVAVLVGRGHADRVRHRTDKAFLVGSVVAVWFVLYFMSGFATTFTQNSLVSSPKAVLLNLFSFGIVALAVEYARHSLILLAGRRHFIWFGGMVAVVLAVQQINFGLLPLTSGLEGHIKMIVSDFIPAIASSFLLTYLAISGGLPSMLTYRLGLLAVVLLPPVIPKYDWYLRGISLMLLAIAVYIVVDRSQRDTRDTPRASRRGYLRRASDVMWLAVMVGLVMFMTGFFSYASTTIVSNSMKPVYSRGAMVIVQKIDSPMDIKVGDIVQYKRTSRMITHRVTAIDQASDGSGQRVFTTQGDNSPSPDEPVTEKQVVGIIKAHIPYIGYPTVWLREASR